METQERIKSSTSQGPRLGSFYLLPNIHELGNPGCPTVSGVSTIMEGVSDCMDSVLFPYIMGVNCYLKEIPDFLKKLAAIGKRPANAILASIDVTSLHTNIPH